MGLVNRLLPANPGIQVSTLLSGSLSTPSAKGVFATTNFISIATGVVDSSGANSVTFSSIPQTYTHLQVRCYSKCTSTGSLLVTFNSSTTGYVNTWTEGNGDTTTVSSGRETTNNAIALYAGISSSTPANYFAMSLIDIINYSNTNMTKTLRAINGYDTNSASPKGYVDLDGGFWNNTSAITSITIATSPNNFVQNSHFALYGIK